MPAQCLAAIEVIDRVGVVEMNTWLAGGIFVGSLLVIGFTYVLLHKIFKTNEYLPDWAKRNGFRIIEQELGLLFNQGWTHIIVEDRLGHRRSGWITFAFFSGKEDIRWDETS